MGGWLTPCPGAEGKRRAGKRGKRESNPHLTQREEQGTVLAGAANRQAKGAPKTRRYLMAASQTIYKGAIVHVNASGLAIPASDTAAQVVVGIAAETRVRAATGNFWIQ